MSKVRVNAFAISLDGYGAGPHQDIESPLGRHGTTSHQWFCPTRSFQHMLGKDTGATGIDDEYAKRGRVNRVIIRATARNLPHLAGVARADRQDQPFADR